MTSHLREKKKKTQEERKSVQTYKVQIIHEPSMSTIFNFYVASEKTNKEFGETKQTWQLRDFTYFMELGF